MAQALKAGETPEQYRVRMAAYQRAYRVKRKAAGWPIPDTRTAEQVRYHDWWKKYRMRPQQVRDMWREQGCVCAVCSSPIAEPGTDGRHAGGSLHTHIDHCHATGKVRGVLCNHCNLALGHAKDDPVRLRKMAAYLEA